MFKTNKINEYAVIGDPISHSLSPLLQQSAFDFVYAQNPDAHPISSYLAYEVKKEGLQNFMRMFKGEIPHTHKPLAHTYNKDVLNLHENASCRIMSGLSVTLPHKKEIMQYADKVSPLALLAGAANTLYWGDSESLQKKILIAENTDITGFLSPLIELYPDLLKKNTCKENPLKSALILGAGGAAAAVFVALLQVACLEKIYISARNLEQAKSIIAHTKNILMQENSCKCQNESLFFIEYETLAENIEKIVEVLPYEEREIPVDIVVNTIPATLAGQNFSPRENFKGLHIAYDLLYAQTPFLELANKNKVRCINGEAMFLAQGAAQFKLWTGLDMPEQSFLLVKSALSRESDL